MLRQCGGSGLDPLKQGRPAGGDPLELIVRIKINLGLEDNNFADLLRWILETGKFFGQINNIIVIHLREKSTQSKISIADLRIRSCWESLMRKLLRNWDFLLRTILSHIQLVGLKMGKVFRLLIFGKSHCPLGKKIFWQFFFDESKISFDMKQALAQFDYIEYK